MDTTDRLLIDRIIVLLERLIPTNSIYADIRKDFKKIIQINENLDQ